MDTIIQNFIFNLIPIVYFALFNSLLVKISKQNFGICMPVSFCLATLFFYFFALCKINLQIPLMIVRFSTIILIVLFIYFLKENDFRHSFFSLGFIIYFAISLFYFFTNYGRHYICWDDFSHWAKFIRHLVEENQLYTFANIYIEHKDYPPFLPLFEYIWLYLSMVKREYITLISIKIFETCIIALPLAEITIKKSTNRVIKYILAILSVIYIILSFAFFDAYNVFNSLLVDFSVASFFALIYLMLNLKDFKYKTLYILVLAFSFPLLKTISLAYVTIIFAYAIFKYIILYIYSKISKSQINFNLKEYWRLPIFMLMSSIVSTIIWTMYNKVNNISKSFSALKFDIKNLINIIAGEGSVLQVRTYNKFINYIFNRPITCGNAGLSFCVIFIFLIALMLIFIIFNRKSIEILIEGISVILMVAFGSISYLLIHLCTFLFLFTDEEMLRLSNFARYIGCFTIGIFFVVLIYFITSSKLKGILTKDSIFIMLYFIVTISIMSGSNLYKITPQAETEDVYKSVRSGCLISSKLISRNNKVSLIFTPEDSGLNKALEYYSRNNSIMWLNRRDDEILNSSFNKKWDITNEMVGNSDYIVIAHLNNEITNNYSYLLTKGTLESGKAYKVINGSDNLKIKRENIEYNEKQDFK